jgi:hypothetical protein
MIIYYAGVHRGFRGKKATEANEPQILEGFFLKGPGGSILESYVYFSDNRPVDKRFELVCQIREGVRKHGIRSNQSQSG